MSLQQQPARPSAGAERVRRPITVLAHPGGRYPGVELPPNWFQGPGEGPTIPSALPAPGDAAGILNGVIQMCTALRDRTAASLAAGEHPTLIGGDHSMAMGSIAAAAAHHGRMAVIWVDAHADFNTMESSPTGNPHGMPLAVSCGVGDPRLTAMYKSFVSPQDVVLIAARDIDPGERALLVQYGIWCVTVEQLRELGVETLVKGIVYRFRGVPVHLSFDFDAISSEYFSATGTPVPEGLMPDEACELLAALAASPLAIGSSDWVEFDPRHEQAAEAAELARRLYRSFHGS
ncbi:MAG: arginase [Cyanobacteria bacterium RYN_339]|nr:arginase [Cyanobacteria bacterium RYN_339]